MSAFIRFCLDQKLVVALLLAFFIGWGIRVAPFEWAGGVIPRDPVPVDAIPDLGENQQIVLTELPGRSPQDIEDQITYPLTAALLGVPGVREIRSYSMFAASYIYLIFEEDVEFYWSRSRILEKLNSLPDDLLPAGATPTLGPDATALGQVFWYVLEGRTPSGEPAGGWDLDELRAIQDWQVRLRLLSAGGVAEVASVGGFEREYQVEVDPDRLRAHRVTLAAVADAVRKSNQEIGARNLAINGVEYILRGTGYIETLDDLRSAVVAVRENTPITVGDVATVQLGPAMRRGALDVNGADAVGGVVVARYRSNPLAVINSVKEEIRKLAPALPARAVIDWTQTTPGDVAEFARAQEIDAAVDPAADIHQEPWIVWLKSHPEETWPEWLTLSQVTVVPFYDRTGLIRETLFTLSEALYQEILVTIIVVLAMVLHLRSSIVISAMLPLAVLITFIAMSLAGVDANIVALAGIAIAIGTVVDVGIVITENILKRLEEAGPDESRRDVIFRATREVASAVTTSVTTTVISFLPVFTLTGEAGRLFRPLAFTKTFALIASIIVALTIIPPAAHILFRRAPKLSVTRRGIAAGLLGGAAIAAAAFSGALAAALAMLAAGLWVWPKLPERMRGPASAALTIGMAVVVAWLLAGDWMPLGLERSAFANFAAVIAVIGGLLALFRLFLRVYAPVLNACLAHKGLFLAVPVGIIAFGLLAWLGAPRVLGWIPAAFGSDASSSRFWRDASEKLPGLGREFRPSLDEGSFLYMPTISPHGSIKEAIDALGLMDSAIADIPEVSRVVGKIGRVESALDPAPISMVETVVNYHPEFKSDAQGRILRFQTRPDGSFAYTAEGNLIPDPGGRPFRNWRPHIQSPDDIWREIERAARIPGATSAPKLQPIETRLVMLRTGMRAPMGLKIKGPSLEAIEEAGLAIESAMRSGKIPGVDVASVIADRIVGKPYLEIVPNRESARNYGLNIADIHETIQTAVGGRTVTTTVEGRERFGVLVRYAREARDSIDALEDVLVTSSEGVQIPLGLVTDIRYIRGPQMIKAEDTFLTGYVTFGGLAGFAEIDIVEAAAEFLEDLRTEGELLLPPGVSYTFAGSYESALEFNRNLAVVLPLCLAAIFLILYLDSRSAVSALIVFSGVIVAWSGGFIFLWLYGQPGFLDFDFFGENLRDVLNVSPINLSTAVWVGFLALFGIATDDGVVMLTYLRQKFGELKPVSVAEVRAAVVEAGVRRVRPCLMTTATTLLALLPVLTATGRGSDLMLPMAAPIFGGMLIEMISMFVVPTLFCWTRERAAKRVSRA